MSQLFMNAESNTISNDIDLLEKRSYGLNRRYPGYCPHFSITLEADDKSVGFYKNIGFICTPFKGNYGVRYNCIQDLSSYLYSRR